jgi:hypothetical protein
MTAREEMERLARESGWQVAPSASRSLDLRAPRRDGGERQVIVEFDEEDQFVVARVINPGTDDLERLLKLTEDWKGFEDA